MTSVKSRVLMIQLLLYNVVQLVQNRIKDDVNWRFPSWMKVCIQLSTKSWILRTRLYSEFWCYLYILYKYLPIQSKITILYIHVINIPTLYLLTTFYYISINAVFFFSDQCGKCHASGRKLNANKYCKRDYGKPQHRIILLYLLVISTFYCRL